MRLKDFEVQVIKDAVYALDKNAKVYLFGSRVDDNKRGGDIDLIISSNKITKSDISKIKLKIFDKLDEQKIDILITDKDINTKDKRDKIFLNIVKEQRVLL